MSEVLIVHVLQPFFAKVVDCFILAKNAAAGMSASAANKMPWTNSLLFCISNFKPFSIPQEYQ